MDPSDDQLRALIAGSLPEEEQRALEDLVGESPELQRRLEQLSGAARFRDEFSPDRESPGIRWSDWLGPSSSPDLLGTLGNYEIQTVIASGGMGVVFRAREPELDRTVAIKMLLPSFVADDDARERFCREATAAAAIEHEHVLPIHAVDRSSAPLPFFVMRHVDGESLEERLRARGALPLDEISRIGRAIASALAAAHARGCIHRDIKPSNILLDGDRTWVTDFGLARIGAESNLTRPGTFMGTPEFCSPEQGQGRPADHRTDLFSLGSVLYAMATGSGPFQGETQASLLYQIVHEPHRPLSRENPAIPTWLTSLVDRLLEKDPERRPESADRVVEAFEHRCSPEGRKSTPRRVALAGGTAVAAAAFAYPVLRRLFPGEDSPKVRITDPGRPGVDSLAAALAEDAPGAAIELDFDGEMDLPPLNLLDRPRWIKASPGRSPVLTSSRSKLPLFSTRSDLVLEGITLLTGAQGRGFDPPLIDIEGGLLALCHCRLHRSSETILPGVSTPLVRTHGVGSVEILDTELYAPGWQLLFFDLGADPVDFRCRIEHSILYGGVALTFDTASDESRAEVTLERNLIAAPNSINLFHSSSPAFPLAFDVTENGFECGRSILNLQKPLETLRHLVGWKERGNGYSIQDAFVQTTHPRGNQRITTLSDWNRQWSQSDTGAIVERLKLGAALHQLTLQGVAPGAEDFSEAVSTFGLPIEPDRIGPGRDPETAEKSDAYLGWRERCRKVFSS